MKRTMLISLVDQALNSAFSLLLNLAFIAFATPAEFGRFAFVLAGSFFAASAQNALIVMPLNYLLPGRPSAEAAAELSMLTSANLALTLLVLPVSLGLGAVIGADTALSLAILAYFLTLMAREYLRNVLVVQGRMARTLVYDAAALAAAAVFATVFWQGLAPEAAVLAGLAAGNALAFLVCRVDLNADLRRLPAHLSAYRQVWRDTRWALQGALQNEVVMRSYVFLVERMRDAAALGRLNAGRVVLSPLLLVGAAWCRVARPRMVEDLRAGRSAAVVGLLRSGAAIVAGAALLYGLCLALAWPYVETYAFRGRYGDMAGIVFCWWLYALVAGLTSVMATLMEARRQFRALAVVGLAGAVLVPVSLFALLFAGFDASAVVLGLAGVSLLECAIFATLTLRDLMAPAAGPDRQADAP